MIVDTCAQPWVFFVCVFLGGVVYLVYKTTHLILFKNKILLAIQDVVFCAITFFVLWRGLLFVNCGQIRLFCLVGIMIGFVVASKIFGVCVDNIVLKMYNFFVKQK